MSYHLVLEIEGLPKTTANANQHWRGRWLESKKWKKLVTDRIDFRIRPALPLSRAEITLTRFAHGKRPDSDNLRASFKHIVDALKLALVILDDSPDVIGEPKVLWESAPPKKGKIKIEVREVA